MKSTGTVVTADTVQSPKGGDSQSRPAGVTTGSPRRPAQQVVGAALAFDLDSLVGDLRADEGWPAGEPNSTTLVKEPSLRVVAVALHAGAHMKRHHVPGRLTIQTLAGHTRVHLPTDVIDLPYGHLVALEAGLTHSVEALDESAILLTIAWPLPG
jgi:quercetin dioxygenase-like cupin family protein